MIQVESSSDGSNASVEVETERTVRMEKKNAEQQAAK